MPGVMASHLAFIVVKPSDNEHGRPLEEVWGCRFCRLIAR
jgi:hypothetical protein